MVFATHERLPLIVPEFKPTLHSYMAGIIRNLDCHVYALDGVSDHCHLIFDLSPKIAMAGFANKLKSGSTKWARREAGQRDFSWQRGYGAFSMNQDSLERAIRYVESQEEHHAKQTFRDELEAFMKVHGMELDPEFVDGIYIPPGAAQ
jgi:REP element-mobilizing transposase RayT